MTLFTVIWTQEALDEITRLWVAAPTELRNAILKAWHRIDDDLARNPEKVGEPRDGGERVGFAFPLGVLFDVDEEKRVVRLLQVWTFNKRK